MINRTRNRHRSRTTGLSAEAWRWRHNVVILSLLAVLPVLVVAGYSNDRAVETVATNVLAVTLFTTLAASDRVDRELRTLIASAGLLTAAAAMVALTSGALAAHLGFIVALATISVYHDRLSYALGIGYVTFYYGVVVRSTPHLVFPVTTMPEYDLNLFAAAIWASGVTISALALLDWRLAAVTSKETEALAGALSEAALRQRQAAELHDNVVQGLVTARYALDAGDQDEAVRQIDQTLGSAKSMVEGLLDLDGVDLSGLLLRDNASQGDLTDAGADDEEGTR